MVYVFIIVKFGLWNVVSDMILRDSCDKIQKDNIKMILCPPTNVVATFIIITTTFYDMMRYILMFLSYPFIRLFNLFTSVIFNSVKKIEEKNEFYEKLNNYCK